MSDSMLPILRQLHDADGDRARADTLLRMPDSVVLKYHRGDYSTPAVAAASRLASAFVELRVSLCLAVRDAAGRAPADLSKSS
jgi:hypothetical protein